MSAAESSTPFACAFATSFVPTDFSTAAQLPSNAETRSSRGVTGQFGFSQDGPSAPRFTSSGWSFRLLKNSCHSASTAAGFCSNRAYISSM